ncbi:MAG: hypothetical protein ACRDRO_10290 [Pseudonocardiaceae bacterium]
MICGGNYADVITDALLLRTSNTPGISSTSPALLKPPRPPAIAKTQASPNWMQIYVAEIRRSKGMEGRSRTVNLLKSAPSLPLWEPTYSLCGGVWGGRSGRATVKRWLMVNGVPYVIIGHRGRRFQVVA